MSRGIGNVSSGKEARKLFQNGNFSIQERVMKIVKYRIQVNQNNTCRVTRYFVLFEKTSGFTFMSRTDKLGACTTLHRRITPKHDSLDPRQVKLAPEVDAIPAKRVRNKKSR
jgi:hypothetical protein